MRPRGAPRVRRAQSELRVLLAVVQGSRGEGCRRAVQRGVGTTNLAESLG